MTLKASEFEAPLEDVDFPDGTNHQPVPFGPTEYRLWREMWDNPDGITRAKMLVQIVRACYPTATDESIGCCSARVLVGIAAHAGNRIEMVREALKNVDGAGATEVQSTTPLSSPKTNGTTSSRKSRRHSVSDGATSTTTRHTSLGTATTG